MANTHISFHTLSIGRFRRPSWASILLLFLIWQWPCALAQTNDSSVSSVVKHSSDAVVLIVISDGAGKEMALGSGFIISADGRIITNYHVIKDGKSAVVKLTNGASFAVDGVIAVDPDKDLAILKVPGRNLTHLDLSDTGSIQIGDHVVAIGSPLGLEGSVSDGIVSAIRDEGSKKWIQTTAPVSHGNSGGPLLDMKGNVVGVITWGVNTQYGQNLNFAIPAETMRTVMATAHEVVPLNAPAARAGEMAKASAPAGIWTSMASGKDFKLRNEGDYIYAEWVNLPTNLQGTSAFSRGEFKKAADGHWHGTSITYLPVQYYDVWRKQNEVKWCKIEVPIEFISVSDSRIEGTSLTSDKVDIRKCQMKNAKETTFTWIPKN